MSTQNANSVAITGGTIDGATIGGTTAGAVTGTTITANIQFTGAGTGLTGTAASLSIGGNAATATSAGSATTATTATNLAGGAAGSVPYQSSSGSTSMLAAGSNGQVLTLSAGLPVWNTPTVGTGVSDVNDLGLSKIEQQEAMLKAAKEKLATQQTPKLSQGGIVKSFKDL
jgi:hypothetical protein